jgi:hypothetical protein
MYVTPESTTEEQITVTTTVTGRFFVTTRVVGPDLRGVTSTAIDVRGNFENDRPGYRSMTFVSPPWSVERIVEEEIQSGRWIMWPAVV